VTVALGREPDDEAAIVAPAERGLRIDDQAVCTEVFDEQRTRGGATAPEGALAEYMPARTALTAKEVTARVGAADRARYLDRVGTPDRPERRLLPAQLGPDLREDRLADAFRATDECIHKRHLHNSPGDASEGSGEC